MHTPPLRQLNGTAIAAALLALFVSACSTTSMTSNSSTTNIEPYTGQDTVGAVSADMFVGQWNVRYLNPPEGAKLGNTQATFAQDGSAVVVSDNNSSGINLKLQMTGSWQASGTMLKTQMESIREVSGSPLGGLLANLMSSMKSNMSGEAEVYEVTENRFVVVSKEGLAIEYSQ